MVSVSLWFIHFATSLFCKSMFNVDYFNNRNKFLTSKLLKQGYRYHKLRKTFSKFYYRHSKLIEKYNIYFMTVLQQGIPENVFCGDLIF